MASTYYDSSGKEVVDGNVAYATDLNYINSAIDTAFQQVESDITTVSSNQSYYADLAEKWAENPEDTAVTPGKYSALHWAAKAEDDKILTAADVVQTNLDKVATAADRVNTNNDKIATAADRVQTGLDRVATAADRVATAADRVQTGLDVVAASGYADDASDFADAAAASAAIFPTIVSADKGKSLIVMSDESLDYQPIQSGRKNYIINGNFDVWQRGTSQTASGYGSDDRWKNISGTSIEVHTRQTFTLGQTDVPDSPKFYSRTVVTSVANSGSYAYKTQCIESVASLAGKEATLSFYAKADAAKNIAIEIAQSFGTGGSPSASILGIESQLVALTTAWQKFSIQITIPSISGKTLGTDGNDFLGLIFWFDAGSNFSARAASLGQQSGTFEIAQVQIEEGEVATEFERRTYADELALCQRYYQVAPVGLFCGDVTSGANYYHCRELPVSMRATPVCAATNAGVAGFPSTVGTVTGYPGSISEVRAANATQAGGYFYSNITLDAEL